MWNICMRVRTTKQSSMCEWFVRESSVRESMEMAESKQSNYHYHSKQALVMSTVFTAHKKYILSLPRSNVRNVFCTDSKPWNEFINTRSCSTHISLSPFTPFPTKKHNLQGDFAQFSKNSVVLRPWNEYIILYSFRITF